MSLTKIYIDPAINNNSGSGKIWDPYGDLEYAIVQETHDTINGNSLNIKQGTPEFLIDDLAAAFADTSVSPAWTFSGAANLVIQGYNTTEKDRGIGYIVGAGGSTGVFNNNTIDNVSFIDLNIDANQTTSACIDLDDYIAFIHCEVHNANTSGNDFIAVDNYSTYEDCYFHNSNAKRVTAIFGNIVRGCRFKDTAYSTSYDCFVQDNLFTSSIESQTLITITNSGRVWNNSIYHSASGTGAGIRVVINGTHNYIAGNIIEGFSGVGGEALWLDPGGVKLEYFAGNAFFDNTTPYADPEEIYVEADNEILTASAFRNAANGDFSPINIGNVKEGRLPNIIGGGFV